VKKTFALVMEVHSPLTPDVVYDIILGVTKVDKDEREHSEALLKKWEKDATPGCLHSLMQIAAQAGNIKEVDFLASLILIYQVELDFISSFSDPAVHMCACWWCGGDMGGGG
jgi:uncharacterized protein YihD (DUF1040 family)